MTLFPSHPMIWSDSSYQSEFRCQTLFDFSRFLLPSSVPSVSLAYFRTLFDTLSLGSSLIYGICYWHLRVQSWFLFTLFLLSSLLPRRLFPPRISVLGNRVGYDHDRVSDLFPSSMSRWHPCWRVFRVHWCILWYIPRCVYCFRRSTYSFQSFCIFF